jgi:hypothetical protein
LRQSALGFKKVSTNRREKKVGALRFYKAAVACAVLDGDTMADRDTHRRRGLALLVRFTVFTALLAFLVIPGAAQEDLSKCRSIANPGMRLVCYDNLSKPTYTRMSVNDFSRDRASLAKEQAKVEVSGRLQELIGGDSYELGSKLNMADRITINIKDLPREQRKAILDRCNTGCDAVVQGRVIRHMGNTWLAAEFFRFLRTPVERAD